MYCKLLNVIMNGKCFVLFCGCSKRSVLLDPFHGVKKNISEVFISELSVMNKENIGHLNKTPKFTQNVLIAFSNFSLRYSTWEPEEHILDPRLVMAYEEK